MSSPRLSRARRISGTRAPRPYFRFGLPADGRAGARPAGALAAGRAALAGAARTRRLGGTARGRRTADRAGALATRTGAHPATGWLLVAVRPAPFDAGRGAGRAAGLPIGLAPGRATATFLAGGTGFALPRGAGDAALRDAFATGRERCRDLAGRRMRRRRLGVRRMLARCRVGVAGLGRDRLRRSLVGNGLGRRVSRRASPQPWESTGAAGFGFGAGQPLAPARAWLATRAWRAAQSAFVGDGGLDRRRGRRGGSWPSPGADFAGVCRPAAGPGAARLGAGAALLAGAGRLAAVAGFGAAADLTGAASAAGTAAGATAGGTAVGRSLGGRRRPGSLGGSRGLHRGDSGCRGGGRLHDRTVARRAWRARRCLADLRLGRLRLQRWEAQRLGCRRCCRFRDGAATVDRTVVTTGILDGGLDGGLDVAGPARTDRDDVDEGPGGRRAGVGRERRVAKDPLEPDLVAAEGGVGPDFRSRNRMLGAESTRRVDAGHWHVQAELGAGLGKQHPLVHRLEVVDRLPGLHLDNGHWFPGRVQRGENEVRVRLTGAGLDRHLPFIPDVDLDGEPLA